MDLRLRETQGKRANTVLKGLFSFKPVTFRSVNCMVSDSSRAWFCRTKGQRSGYEVLNLLIQIREDLFWETKWGWCYARPFLLLYKTQPAWHWRRPHLTFDLVLWPGLRFFLCRLTNMWFANGRTGSLTRMKRGFMAFHFNWVKSTTSTAFLSVALS